MINRRDSQRGAVYKWGDTLLGKFPHLGRELTLAECVDYVYRVWYDYHPYSGVPRVSDGRGRRSACGNRRYISLPRWARDPGTVLHEIAHSLQTEMPWHGPQFARLFLELLAHYEGVPKSAAKSLGVHQRPRRVRFASPTRCPRRIKLRPVK